MSDFLATCAHRRRSPARLSDARRAAFDRVFEVRGVMTRLFDALVRRIERVLASVDDALDVWDEAFADDAGFDAGAGS